MSSDKTTSLRIVALLLVFGVTTVVRELKKIKKKTKIKNISKQVICAASAGSVELEGVAWPLRTIHQSLEGKKIVCRSIIIKKRVRRGNKKSYETVWTKNSSEPFLVFDQTGYVLVEPAYSLLQSVISDDVEEKKYSPFNLKREWIDGFNNFYDNSVEDFRVSSGNSFFSQLFSPDFIILEKIIEVGSPLLIHGHLTPEDTPRYISQGATLISFREKVTRIMNSKSLQLKFLDKNKDSKVDDKELRRGFQGALAVSLKSPLAITDIKNVGESHERIFGILKSNKNEDLLVSNAFEEQLLNSNPIIKNWIMLYLGAGLIGAAIILFIKFIL